MRSSTTLAVVVFVGALPLACSQPAPVPPPTTAATTPASTPAPAPAPAPPQDAASEAPPAQGQRWDITRIRCDQLLGASDADRSAASMFYYGYVAASDGVRHIDVSRIEDNTHRVMEACANAPSQPALRVYEQTLKHGL